MNLDDDTRKELEQPLDPRLVQQVQTGRGMSPYIAGHVAISAANRIFDYDGWQILTVDVQMVRVFTIARTRTRNNAQEQYEATVTLYRAIVQVEALGVVRTDIGLGTAENDTPEAHDTGIKGAVTDAMKRALRTFGEQFGNGLYDRQSPSRGNANRPASTEKPQAARQTAPRGGARQGATTPPPATPRPAQSAPRAQGGGPEPEPAQDYTLSEFYNELYKVTQSKGRARMEAREVFDILGIDLAGWQQQGGNLAGALKKVREHLNGA